VLPLFQPPGGVYSSFSKPDPFPSHPYTHPHTHPHPVPLWTQLLEEICTDGAWRLKDLFGKKRCRNKCVPIYIDSSDWVVLGIVLAAGLLMSTRLTLLRGPRLFELFASNLLRSHS